MGLWAADILANRVWKELAAAGLYRWLTPGGNRGGAALWKWWAAPRYVDGSTGPACIGGYRKDAKLAPSKGFLKLKPKWVKGLGRAVGAWGAGVDPGK